MNKDIKQNKDCEVDIDREHLDSVADDGGMEIKYTYVLNMDRGTEEDLLYNSYQSGHEQNSVPSMELNQEAFPKVTIKTEFPETLLDSSSMAYFEKVGNISSELHQQFPKKNIWLEDCPAYGVSQNYGMNGTNVEQLQTDGYVHTITDSIEKKFPEKQKHENEVFNSTAKQATCSSSNTALGDIVKVESLDDTLNATVEDIVKVESLDDTLNAAVEDIVKVESLDDTLNAAHVDTFRAHFQGHDTSKTYVCCSLCKITVVAENYEKHFLRHKCSVCEKILRNQEALKKHMFSHNEGIYLECSIGKKLCMAKRHLYIHGQVHGKKFPCNLCDRKFAGHTYLHHHLQTHKEHLPVSCSVCNRKITVDGKYISKKHYCKRCKQSFVTRAEWLSHKSVHRKTCYICAKVVLNDSQLYYHHLKFHSEKLRKPYYCEYCSKRFSMLILLQAHRRCKHRDCIKGPNGWDSQVLENKSVMNVIEAAADVMEKKPSSSSATDSYKDNSVAWSSKLTVAVPECSPANVGEYCTDNLVKLKTVKSKSAFDRSSEERYRTGFLPAEDFASDSTINYEQKAKNSERHIFPCGKTEQCKPFSGKAYSSVHSDRPVSESFAKKIIETGSQIPNSALQFKGILAESLAEKSETNISSQDLAFQCKVCPSMFKYLLDLKNHIRKSHKAIKKLKNYHKC